MSALGQKQTSRHLQLMSALPPKADVAKLRCHVRFVPKADSCTAASNLFNHCIGCRKQRWRNRDAECFGRPEIDHQFVFRRCLNRKISWLFALKYAVDVTRSTPKFVDLIG